MNQCEFQVDVEYLTEAPAKPPCRVLIGNMVLRNNSAEEVYFVVPFFLDEPLGEVVPKVECLEVFKTEKNGALYLCIHRDPACYLFPVAGESKLSLPNWRFMTWSEKVSTDIYVVDNPLLNESLPIGEWLAGMPIPEPVGSDDAYMLLLEHVPADETRLTFGEPLAKIAIDLSA